MGAHMLGFSFSDWITYGSIGIAAFLLAVNAAIASLAPLRRYTPALLKHPAWGFVPFCFFVIGASAFTYRQFQPVDFFLPKDAESGSPFSVIQAWGYNNGVFYTVIKTVRIVSDKKLKKVVLVVRVPFVDRDAMTDTSIIKSQTYTIIDEFMTLAVPILGHDTFKLILNDITPISYYVVEIPFMFSSDDIRSLSDITAVRLKVE
jgi:hypothetical protein